jgi:hypothetical protein
VTHGPNARQKIYPYTTEYGSRLHHALMHARDVPDEELVRLPLDAVAEALVDEHAATPIVIHFDQLWWELQDSPVRAGPQDGSLEVAVKVTANGCTGALMSRANLPFTMYNSGEEPTVVSVHMRLKDQDPDDLATESFELMLSVVRESLLGMEQSANVEIARHRAQMLSEALEIVRHRGRRVKAFRQAADQLGIPIAPRSGGGLIELKPRGITVQELDHALASGIPDHYLEAKVAEHIVTTIMSFTAALERLNTTADKLAGEDEETIRDLLLFILNSNYQGAATGETFVGHGKTDILLRWRNRGAFIGECKFWTGSKKFTEAISQLLDQYTVWRDTQVALILFIRDIVGISDVIEKASACIVNSGRLIQAITPEEPDRRRDYFVRSANDERRTIRLTLLPVVIPRQSVSPNASTD